MAFLPDVKSLEKLLNNDWKNLVYGKQSETWNQKLYSLGFEARDQIFMFLESRGRQLRNYWPLYAAFFVVTFIILATYKSLRNVGTIKLRKTDKCERRVKQEIRTEVSRIISDDDSEGTESFAVKPCPNSPSNLDNSTATQADNDYHSRHDSSVSSDSTIVAFEGKKGSRFLRKLMNTIKPGDDTVDHAVSTNNSEEDAEDNNEMLDLMESTRSKVDSNNCKHFYVLTPWIGPPEDQESCAPAEAILSPSVSAADDAKAESLMHQNSCLRATEQEEINNVTDYVDLVKSGLPEVPTVKTVLKDDGKSKVQTKSESANSTLAINHESSSICCADEILSRVSDTVENIVSSVNIEKQSELSTTSKIESHCSNLESVLDNFVQKLPELDLSPISRVPLKTENAKNDAKPQMHSDSKHRFRSLSHDNRTVSSAVHVGARRGNSVSPPTRNKNKQRSVKLMQSKIPTLSPLAHRQMHQRLGADETVAEAANQIRSVLLRKLKEVWEQHPRDRTPSPHSSVYSSLDSSIYYTPENISRIPLLRRSPRQSDANDLSRSSRVGSQSDRSANTSGQSRPGYSEITNVRSFPADVSTIPLHSTPKTSPSSRGSNHRR